MKFQIFGPFELPRADDILDSETPSKNAFWDQVVNASTPGLSGAKGCYVFAIKDGRYKPWYIGKAEKNFKQEALNDSNIVKFNRVLNKRRGVPGLFLLANISTGGKLSIDKSESRARAIRHLEKRLIAMAMNANSDLLNERDTKIPRELEVIGFINTDMRKSRDNACQELRKAFDL